MLNLIKCFVNMHGVKDNEEWFSLLIFDTANTAHCKLITFNMPLNVWK